MFSVLWKIPGGVQDVFEAESVTHKPEGVVLTFAAPGQEGRDIDCGDVYVMNENGKTVATYHLGDKSP